MKFIVITTYEDKESYCYPIATVGELRTVVNDMRERRCRLVTLRELEHECSLTTYGDNVVVLIPADLEAEAYLPKLLESQGPTIFARDGVDGCVRVPETRNTPAYPSCIRVFLDGEEHGLIEGRYVPLRALREWGAARSQVPVPRSQT